MPRRPFERQARCDVFHDRSEPFTAFLTAYQDHRTEVGRGEFDLHAPRRNVVTFRGVGGIGKSEFSRRVEAWATLGQDAPDHWPANPSDEPALTLRIDDPLGADLALILLRLRSAIGDRMIDWAAFDLAFTVFWDVHHPGDGSPLGNLPSEIGPSIREALLEAFSEVVPNYGTLGLGVRAVQAAIGVVREQRVRTACLADCKPLAEMLEVIRDGAIDEATDQLPYLFTWCLRRAPNEGPPPMIVFVDHYERLNESPSRTREYWFQSMVHWLPDVFWVISGRRELDWFDGQLRGRLEYVGTETWPALAPGGAGTRHQYLLEDLGADDARQLLEKLTASLDIALHDDVARRILEVAGGHPLFLSLSVRDVAELIRSGHEVVAADVRTSFDSLVERVLRFLPADEARALRTACLLNNFTRDVVVDAAGIEVGTLRRLEQRSLVLPTSDQLAPFRIHDRLRSAVRGASANIPGGWDEQDWRAAATALLEVLQTRIDEADDPEIRGVHLKQALTVAFDVDVEIDWAVAQMNRLPSHSMALRCLPSESPDTDFEHALMELIRTLATTARHAERYGRLTRLANSVQLSPAMDERVTRWRAYGLRGEELFDDALDLILRCDLDKPINRYQAAYTAARGGRFDLAFELSDPLDGHRQARIHGLIDDYHGRQALAIETSRARADQLLKQPNLRLALEIQTEAEYRQALSDPSTDGVELQRVRQEAEETWNVAALAYALAGLVITNASLADRGITSDLEILASIDEDSFGARGARWAHAATLAALVREDDTLIREILAVRAAKPRRGPIWWRIDTWLRSRGIHPGSALEPISFLEPEDIVEQRWIAILDIHAAAAQPAGRAAS